MILMPDPATAILDPFFEETTLNLRCDIIEPATMQGYERDPRSLGKRAEAYLKSTGIADGALFGPENEFFIFDSVKSHSAMNSTGYTIDSYRAPGTRTPSSRTAQPRPSSGREGRLLPGSAGGCLPGHPQRHVQRAGRNGPGRRSAPSRSGHRRPVRNRRWRRRPGQEGRRSADPEVRDPERGRAVRQDGDLHAEAAGRRQRLGHARAPVAAEGRQGAVRRRQVRRSVGDGAVLHRRHHQARQGHQRVHQSGHQQLQAPGAGLRSARDAGLLGPQSFGLDPYSLGSEPEGTPHRSAFPGFAGESVPRLLRP